VPLDVVVGSYRVLRVAWRWYFVHLSFRWHCLSPFRLLLLPESLPKTPPEITLPGIAEGVECLSTGRG
jgi:hypothetical protein